MFADQKGIPSIFPRSRRPYRHSKVSGLPCIVAFQGDVRRRYSARASGCLSKATGSSMRGEAFNAFNHVNSLATPSTFGELTKMRCPRHAVRVTIRILIVTKLRLLLCPLALLAAATPGVEQGTLPASHPPAAPTAWKSPTGKSTNTIPISTSSANRAAPITRSPSSISSSAANARSWWSTRRRERCRRRNAAPDRPAEATSANPSHSSWHTPTRTAITPPATRASTGLANVTLVPATVEAEQKAFAITQWPEQAAVLSGRPRDRYPGDSRASTRACCVL